MPVKKTKEHPDGASQKPKSWDDFFASPVRATDDFIAEREQPKDQASGGDAELECLVDMMTASVHEAVKEVRAVRKLVRKANQHYAQRKVA